MYDLDINYDETDTDLDSAAEHVDTLLEGTLDTIQGNESYNGGLTYAQRYLHAVLGANGHPVHNVHGTESVMDSIKSGLNKVWEAIKNGFKAVWNFLTGGGNAEKRLKEMAVSEKEMRQKTADVLKNYTGEIEKEKIAVYVEQVRNLEKFIDKELDAIESTIEDVPSGMNINDGPFEQMKKEMKTIRSTYKLMEVVTGVHKVTDIPDAAKKLLEIYKKIADEKHNVGGYEASVTKGINQAQNLPSDRKEESEKMVKIFQILLKIVKTWVTVSSKKQELCDKLFSKFEAQIDSATKQAAAALKNRHSIYI